MMNNLIDRPLFKEQSHIITQQDVQYSLFRGQFYFVLFCEIELVSIDVGMCDLVHTVGTVFDLG